MYWSFRRELWEYRSVYIAPLAVAGLTLFGFLIRMITWPHRMRAAMTLDAAKQHQAVAMPYEVAAGLIMGTAFFVGLFYCLEALHGERQDRSILFWKSLPVSDLTTVLAKMSIPLVVLPLLSVVLTVATQFVMLLLNAFALLVGGLSVSTLWTHVPLWQMSLGLLYHMVTVHALWYAPIYGWLLLISVWARRATFLWAALPPLAIALIEKMVFNTWHFASWLGYRVGGPDAAARVPMEAMTALSLGKVLSTPGLWFGLGFAALFLALAARLRRYREPI
jgi:ABC-2 type transport system permease protein